MSSENWIVIIGNPVDGLSFFGPFGSQEDAHRWIVDDTSVDCDWWLVELGDPNEDR